MAKADERVGSELNVNANRPNADGVYEPPLRAIEEDAAQAGPARLPEAWNRFTRAYHSRLGTRTALVERETDALIDPESLEIEPAPEAPFPRRKKPDNLAFLTFLVIVVIPTLLVAFYYGVIASNVYTSEFRFAISIVNASNSNGSSQPVGAGAAVPGAGASGGLASMLGGYAIANPSLQNYLVVDYINSKQAVEDVSDVIDLRKAYSRSNVDFLQRLGSDSSKEDLYKYWKNMTNAIYDPVTGIAIAQFKAFTPEDAHAIGQAIAKKSEELVNSIDQKPQIDAIRFAEGEVNRLQERLKESRVKMQQYRVKFGVIEPNAGAVNMNNDLIKQLRSNIVSLTSDLEALSRQDVLKNSPAARVIQSKIASFQQQLAKLEGETKDNTGSGAMSELVGQYEALDLDRQFAQAMLVNARQALDQARANAAAQHAYLTPYVKPTIPETAEYPKRFLMTLYWFLSLVAVWVIALTLWRSVKDHAI